MKHSIQTIMNIKHLNSTNTISREVEVQIYETFHVWRRVVQTTLKTLKIYEKLIVYYSKIQQDHEFVKSNISKSLPHNFSLKHSAQQMSNLQLKHKH